VVLESELAEEKAKGKAIEVFKTDLDNKRNEISLLEKKLDKKQKPRQNIWKNRMYYSSATTR
jgi:hypothetical protein